MAKASPARRNFNGGEVSVLVEGRTDLESYGASMRRMSNAIAAPQGPFIGRSGTDFIVEAAYNDKHSALVPFNFNEDETLNLEFADKKIRFIFETGLQIYAPVPVEGCINAGNHPVFTSSALNASVGDDVVLDGFKPEEGINTRTGKIVSKTGNMYKLDIVTDIAFTVLATSTIAKVYCIVSPYTADAVDRIRAVQDQDTVYLFCKGYQPRVLSRKGTYDWTLVLYNFQNGPFMKDDSTYGLLEISDPGTSAAVATIASDTLAGSNSDFAFDGNTDTYWSGNTEQRGYVGLMYAIPRTVTGYVIYPAYKNNDATYAATDFAPSSWTFEASNDGSTWIVLDTQRNYILYDEGRSVWFQFTNQVAYSYYRINITELGGNGPLKPCVAELVLSHASPSGLIILSIVGSTTLNNGQGFLPTDAGRLVRAKGSDGYYRVLQIKAQINPVSCLAQLQSEPFPDKSRISSWAVGYYSDTTGWPHCATFFEDRLYVAGSPTFPGLVVGSRTGVYDDFQQKTSLDKVLDDGAVIMLLKSRKVSDIRWIETDERGLLLGTGAGENVISAVNVDNGITSRNVKGRNSTQRGSASIEPVKVDRNILHVHISRRSIREFSYSQPADGYSSRSLSLLASHLGVPQLAQMVYASEPHSIVWLRRDDGSVIGLTYNKEENVFGWHTHDFGGVVESMSSVLSVSTKQDVLWMVVRRTINGHTKRYIERLSRFWDFDSTIENATYVDCNIKYVGNVAVSTLYGLDHLEGKALSGLADSKVVEDIIVNRGQAVIPFAAKKVVLGLPYVQFGEIARIEAGAADGTSQGKVKRINVVAPHMWDSAFGEIGRFDMERQEYVWTDIEYKEPFDELEDIALQTEVLKPVTMAPGYDNAGTIAFRQTKPLPLNVVALYPQLNTQDR